MYLQVHLRAPSGARLVLTALSRTSASPHGEKCRLTLKGFPGASVLEIIAPFKTDTYRLVYTIQLGSAIYVLCAFKKKAKEGRKTPKKEMDLIKTRLACISHHPTVEARDTTVMTSLRLLAVLNVLFKYACARQAARASS